MDVKGTLAAIKASGKPHYVYVLKRPCGAAFYVGVGTGRRIAWHERAARAGRAGPRFDVIREIIASGGGVIYEITAWLDEWDLAAAEERRLIAAIGRADLGLGSLLNLTTGGQGIHGARWHASPARIDGARRAAEKNRGRKASPEHRAKIGAAHRGRRKSPSEVAKLSAANKGRPLSVEHRTRISKARQGQPAPNKGKTPSDKTRAKMSAAHSAWRPSPAVLAAGAAWRAANAEAISAARRRQWEDPAYRQKMIDVKFTRTK